MATTRPKNLFCSGATLHRAYGRAGETVPNPNLFLCLFVANLPWSDSHG